MKNPRTTHRNASLWLQAPRPRFPRLEGRIDVDVVVVGAGISGITAAHLLAEDGLKVALLDRAGILEGETGHTTAHLTEIIDTRYRTLTSDFGERAASLVASSSRAAIERIVQWVEDGQIDCGFRRVDGYLYTDSQSDVAGVEEEVEAARRAGLAAELVREVPAPFRVKAALKLGGQAQFHPVTYLLKLVQNFKRAGGQIFEESAVLDVEDGESCRVVTDGGELRAGAVIVVTNSPVCNRFTLHTKVAAYRTYALAARLERDVADLGLFWDTADPYHYTRIQDVPGEGRLTIIGGADHKTGMETDTEDSFRKLEAYAREHFPVKSIPYRWSGQVMEPVDGLPYIGRNPHSKNLYVGTGYSGNGMTFGTIAGMLLSQLAQGKNSPWEALYDPARIKPLASAKDFVMENKDFPERMIMDRLVPSEVSALEEIARGEARTLKLGGKQVAAFRDDAGTLHTVSRVCPHLGCLVHWNNAERSWDCPCHGSRFTIEGEVLHGPAVCGLKPLSSDETSAPR